jgi:NAD(P)-dependent dehydrogenase (short-subunit alcohol dehydrogenase family)
MTAATPDTVCARRLQGRRILITGAAAGIGQATARLFAAEGAALMLLDQDAEGLARMASETGANVYATDVSDEEAVARVVEQGASAMGGIDGVVNCAGIHLLRGSVLDVSVAQWLRLLNVNLTGAYIVVRHCLPWLKQASGSTIVNIGSVQSLLPNTPNRTAYATSKGGLLNLSRSLAAELAPAIRVNTVCPGLVDTPTLVDGQTKVGDIALKRLAQPFEIARAILFLTSAESSYVTGAALAVDGGRAFH